MGQEFGHGLAGSLFRVSQGCCPGVGWAALSFGGLNGEECFKAPLVCLQNLFPHDYDHVFTFSVICWLSIGGCPLILEVAYSSYGVHLSSIELL